MCSSLCKIQHAGGTCLFCGQTGLGSRPEELPMMLVLVCFQAAGGYLGNFGNYKFQVPTRAAESPGEGRPRNLGFNKPSR